MPGGALASLNDHNWPLAIGQKATLGPVGGMGMAPSADMGDRHAVFQPSHGSAPDIAGKGIANPVATILSVQMMLEWFGHPEGAALVKRAVEEVFRDPGSRTWDLGGPLSTTAMGDLIVEKIVKFEDR